MDLLIAVHLNLIHNHTWFYPEALQEIDIQKSTGDIVSDNLIFHLDGGDSKSYAGVTTSGSIIYDLKEGTNSTGKSVSQL